MAGECLSCLCLLFEFVSVTSVWLVSSEDAVLLDLCADRLILKVYRDMFKIAFLVYAGNEWGINGVVLLKLVLFYLTSVDLIHDTYQISILVNVRFMYITSGQPGAGNHLTKLHNTFIILPCGKTTSYF